MKITLLFECSALIWGDRGHSIHHEIHNEKLRKSSSLLKNTSIKPLVNIVMILNK